MVALLVDIIYLKFKDHSLVLMAFVVAVSFYFIYILRRHSEIPHVQARIAHVQPTTGSSICEDGKKTCTQFFVKTSVDLIMPTSRSNENFY